MNYCLLIQLDSEGEIAIIGSNAKNKLEIIVEVLLFVKQSE